MIQYYIKHHVPGRVKVHIPLIKRISLTKLYSLKAMEIPDGIMDVKPNPITGNVVIDYDPLKIDIETFLNSLAASEEIMRLLEDKK